VIAAVDQLGIAETVVNTLFTGLVALIVLAAGLAFGLGGQQTAAQITANWYARGREAGAKVAEYAQAQSQASGGETTRAQSRTSAPAEGGDTATGQVTPPPATRGEPTEG
jgi:hypothetical protein